MSFSAQTVVVFAVTLGEVLCGERAVFLGDARYVGTRVENPDRLGGGGNP